MEMTSLFFWNYPGADAGFKKGGGVGVPNFFLAYLIQFGGIWCNPPPPLFVPVINIYMDG